MHENFIPLLVDPSHHQVNFSRMDESDDALFYSKERLVSHLDSLALETIVDLIENLVVEDNPTILDLMASWDSHIPVRLRSCRITGLGMNETELKKNEVLSDYVVHDLNRDCRLPFPDGHFDVVLNTVSVDYLKNPVEVFREVGRILKPGGLFLVIFSNRMFPEKAVKIWRESSEEERILLLEEIFQETGAFDSTGLFISKGRPRPSDDKYANLGTPSDPVYAIYAEKPGKAASRKSRPPIRLLKEGAMNKDTLETKKEQIHKTLRCPHCDEKMKKWAVPENPFEATWENEFLYICFNDNCPYYVRGWDHVYKTTSRMASYRFMYNQDKDICSPIPVPSPKALRESIID
ncbi:MAG: methyltransferase domain-containing protein [Acidobacteria bacterium]|nr:methyltransferase domain-containing protein [Acidobacteriota bacterium]